MHISSRLVISHGWGNISYWHDPGKIALISRLPDSVMPYFQAERFRNMKRLSQKSIRLHFIVINLHQAVRQFRRANPDCVLPIVSAVALPSCLDHQELAPDLLLSQQSMVCK